MSDDVRIVPLDLTNRDHAALLFTSLAQSLHDQWPWSAIERSVVVTDVRRALLHRDAFALAAESAGETMGVSVGRHGYTTNRGEVVWCYVGYLYRRNGLGTKLCAPAGPAPWVRYYTRATVRIALEHGRELHWAGR